MVLFLSAALLVLQALTILHVHHDEHHEEHSSGFDSCQICIAKTASGAGSALPQKPFELAVFRQTQTQTNTTTRFSPYFSTVFFQSRAPPTNG
jgi:hypothetical protein